MYTDAKVNEAESSVKCKSSFYNYISVQPVPFVKPHSVFIVAIVTVLFIGGRFAHLYISRRILMQA